MRFEKEIDELNEKETYESAMSWEEVFELRLNTEKQEEREKEKINIAKNLLSLNIDLDDISRSTGLSIDEINELKNN